MSVSSSDCAPSPALGLLVAPSAVAFWVLMVASVAHMSLTVDEPGQAVSGAAYWSLQATIDSTLGKREEPATALRWRSRS